MGKHCWYDRAVWNLIFCFVLFGCSFSAEGARYTLPVNDSPIVTVMPTVVSDAALVVSEDESPAVVDVYPEDLLDLRAIWVQFEAAQTEEAADVMLDRVVQGGFDTVLYCVGSGAVPYRSSLLTRLPYVTDDYDPLAYVVEQAHVRGLRVEAWWSPGLLMKYGVLRDERPEWDIASLEEIPDDVHWPNFSLPDVRLFVEDVVIEIVDNYEVDAVHLDYIRYPRLCSSDGLECDNFFDAADVSRTVEGVYRRLEMHQPDVQLSAAVKADGGSSHLQNWRAWLEENYIDYVMPMAYLDPGDIGQLRQYLKEWESLENAGRIVPGLSIVVDFESKRLKMPEQLLRQINLCRKYGFENFSIFDERLIDDRLLDVLAESASLP